MELGVCPSALFNILEVYLNFKPALHMSSQPNMSSQPYTSDFKQFFILVLLDKVSKQKMTTSFLFSLSPACHTQIPMYCSVKVGSAITFFIVPLLFLSVSLS